MKIILLIALIICMAAQVFAGVNHTVVTHVNLSDLSAGVDDTITIALGGQVAVNQGDTVRGILVGGGEWFSAGGNKIKTSGFSMTSGTTTLGPADTIEISNQNVFNTHDFYIGAGAANFTGTVANPTVIRTDPTTYGNGSVIVTGASAVLNWSNVKFVNMSDPTSGLNTAGVNFQTRTTATNNSITNMSGDTATFATYNCTGFKWNGGTVVVVNGQDQGLVSYGGSADSIINVRVTTDAQNGFFSVQNGTYYLTDTVTALSPTTGAYGFFFSGGTKNGKVLYSRVQGFFGCLAIPTNSRHDSLYVYGSRFDGGAATHTLCLLGLTKGTKIVGSQFYGGTTRMTVGTYDGSVVEDLKLYYNTIGGQSSGQGWVKAPICFDCITGYSCTATITGLDMVGNIVFGKNASFNNADIWVSGGLNVQLTRFQANALDKIDTSSAGAHFAMPVGSWPGTNKVTSNFAFQDSTSWDFRLASGSPMLNCGDSAIFVQYMGGVNYPGDIGYYQSNIAGACGGVPTGACCFLDGTCGDRTAAQCAAQSGDYKGDGTNCATTTCPSGPPTGTQHFTHTKFAAMTYSVDPYTTQSVANGRFLGQHMDLIINPTSYINGIALGYNPNLKMITYETITSVRETDTIDIKAMATEHGWQWDTLLVKTGDAATVSVKPPQPMGGPCIADNCRTTGPNQLLLYCQWNTWRNEPDWNKPGIREWAIWKLVNSGSSFPNIYGVMEDEAYQDYYVGNLGATWLGALASPKVPGPFWPLEGYWCTGSWSDCKGWETYVTHDQIRTRMLYIHDTLIPIIVDTMNALGRKLFSNGAAYAIDSAQLITDIKRFGRSILYGEGMAISPTYNSYKTSSWSLMDSLAVWGPLKGGEASIWVYTNRQDSLDMPAGDRWKRIVHHNYCWYMMAVSPYTYFTPIGNEPGGTGQPFLAANSWNVTDSTYKWLNEFAVDVGLPTSARYITVAGTYPVYRRDFAKGAILYRPGAHSADMTDASAVTVNLGEGFHRVNYDSSKQAWSTSTTIRVGDGAVLVDSSYFIPHYDTTLTLSGNSATEGQNMVFTVTQNRALSNINYFAWYTTGGTAQSNVDFTAQVDMIGSIGPGELTTTLSVPTSDDVLVEGSETFTVTINSQTYGTITTGTATGTIIDNDAEGQPGSAKHFPKWRKKQ